MRTGAWLLGGIAAVALWGGVARADERVLVRSDHAEVEVEGERYRLVTRQAPLSAVVLEASGQKRLVVNVVRLGQRPDEARTSTPLLVTVGRSQKVFPNRPALVEGRKVSRGPADTIASYPVRYPLRIGPRGQIPVRVALRRRDDEGTVGVRLTLEEPKDTLLTPLGTVKKKKPRKSRPVAKKPRRQKAAKDEPPPRTVAALPAARPDAGTDDGGAGKGGPDPGPDAGTADAHVVVDVKDPAPAVTAGLRVKLVDAMGDRFVLREVLVELDDGTLLSVEDAAGSAHKTLAVFDGAIAPGPHRLRVFLKYVGDGGFFFSYLDAYSFYVSDEVTFDAPGRGAVDVVVTGEEQGNMFTTPLEERPSLRFSVQGR